MRHSLVRSKNDDKTGCGPVDKNGNCGGCGADNLNQDHSYGSKGK